jgi:low temperature requirement protein LtrA
LEHRHTQHADGRARGRFARDVYTYTHAPIVGGLIMTAAALEEITLHPTDPLDGPFRWLLAGGLGLYLLGIATAVIRAFGVLAIERVIIAVIAAVVIAGLQRVDGIVVLAVVDALLVTMLLVEHRRIEVNNRSIAIR